MGRQRAHRRAKERQERAIAFADEHCTPIGAPRRVTMFAPSRSLRGLTAQYHWPYVCGHELRARGPEISRRMLLACEACGQVFQQRREPPIAMQPVRLPDDLEVCEQLQIRIVGTTPSATFRGGLGLSFDVRDGRVEIAQRRGQEWDVVGSTPDSRENLEDT